MAGLSEVARITLPTAFGLFEARAFDTGSGRIFLALVKGDLRGPAPVLVRLHSECLTGDTLGSLRCDCGEQLRMAFGAIAAEGRGVLLYALGDEGRGIGLVDKLRAYAEQDRGADTVDANLRLGLPVDARDHREAGRVLLALDVRSVRLLSNNPEKAGQLRSAGVEVVRMEEALVTPHLRNVAYLRTKGRRMGHLGLAPAPSPPVGLPLARAGELLGEGKARPGRPRVILKFAQTLDGRIATGTGDSKWISGEDERRLSHALRASVDAVLVGIGTVLSDDPRLTVRMVPGSSPIRVVLDSRLRVPPSANVLSPEAPTLVFTSSQAPSGRRRKLRTDRIGVRVVEGSAGGLSLPAVLAELAESGVETLLVEGGSRVITSLLGGGLVDRMIVSLAPMVLGEGTQAVGDLGLREVSEGLRLRRRLVTRVGEDVVIAGDLDWRTGAELEAGEAGSAAG